MHLGLLVLAVSQRTSTSILNEWKWSCTIVDAFLLRWQLYFPFHATFVPTLSLFFSSSLSPKSQNRWGRAFRRHPSLLLMLTPLFRQRLKAGNYQWRVRPAWTWDPTTVVLPTTAALARYYRLSRCVIFTLVSGDERRSSTQRWSKKYNPDAFSSRNGVLEAVRQELSILVRGSATLNLFRMILFIFLSICVDCSALTTTELSFLL